MRIPKVRHKKLENLGKNLYLCEDARSTLESKFEGSAAGGGYQYLGYENPAVKVEKAKAKWKRVLRKSQSSQVKQEPATSSGNKENG